MFEFKQLKQMSEEELRGEFEIVMEYQDRLVGLGQTLQTVCQGCEALNAIYAGQKGHDVFLMALEVVAQSTASRGQAVAARLSTAMRYADNILALLGEEPELRAEWPAYEQQVEWVDPDAFKGKKAENS